MQSINVSKYRLQLLHAEYLRLETEHRGGTRDRLWFRTGYRILFVAKQCVR
jgi:hypothetical protein